MSESLFILIFFKIVYDNLVLYKILCCTGNIFLTYQTYILSLHTELFKQFYKKNYLFILSNDSVCKFNMYNLMHIENIPDGDKY